MYTVHHHIAGHVQPSTSGRHADIFNPAIGRVQGQVDLGTAQELDQAVAAAQAAFTAWSAQPPLARARVMFRFLALLQQRQAQLAETIVQEQGKTLPDAPAAGRGRWHHALQLSRRGALVDVPRGPGPVGEQLARGRRPPA
jgi:malonate-semialdehyde dehydrogenase (acetylating) / methylmalonate-semialdehyde dehydrogenase